MVAILVEGPAAEPVTLAEAKAHARIDGEAEDGLVGSLIAAARAEVENRTGRALVTQKWRIVKDQVPASGVMRLAPAPVRSVEVDGFWIDERPVTVAQFRRFVKATGHVTVAERAPEPADFPDADPGLVSPAAKVVDHEVTHRSLEEIAEPAPGGVGAVEVAAEEPDGKLLRQLLGGVRVAGGAQEIAVDRAGVAHHQLSLRRSGRVGGASMGLEDQRPTGLDLAQVRVRLAGAHGRSGGKAPRAAVR